MASLWMAGLTLFCLVSPIGAQVEIVVRVLDATTEEGIYGGRLSANGHDVAGLARIELTEGDLRKPPRPQGQARNRKTTHIRVNRTLLHHDRRLRSQRPLAMPSTNGCPFRLARPEGRHRCISA